VPPSGGDGGRYESTSSGDDRGGYNDGVLGESERGPDVPAIADIEWMEQGATTIASMRQDPLARRLEISSTG